MSVARRFGDPRHHLEETGSTNDVAREFALEGAADGTIVTAERQSAGRGRHGRRWSAPAGTALLCSAILRPLASGGPLLPLAAPLAVCEAIETVAPIHCRVKWPNDVWIERRKVAGILIEARAQGRSAGDGGWAVIGIGINVAIEPDQFPADLRWPATSVGHGVAVESVLESVNGALDRWTAATDQEILGEFRRRDALAGEELSWEGAGRGPGRAERGRGIARGIDGAGNLLVETATGTVALGSGEVTLSLDRGPGR